MGSDCPVGYAGRLEASVMQKLLDIKLTKEELDRGEAAAIRAGYSPKNARRTASRLLRTPAVRARIAEGLKQREDGAVNAV